MTESDYKRGYAAGYKAGLRKRDAIAHKARKTACTSPRILRVTQKEAGSH